MSTPRRPGPRLVALGRAVQQLRATQRLTIATLSEASRLTPSYLHAIEHAEINLAYLVMCRLADALHVAPHELVALAAELHDDDRPQP